ncbi:hypothetical protein [Sphingopyxis sp. JAI128]|uniref:hypothetical protein n=1 Tax=Sphingopyxis sp. JAI128 TaxID=2723066 RepID=UPI001612449B|nr:hypothetical protein [Sphingopyxis sp. JAI128]MBB6424925.1 hypothetical protein [Sphingopyxis sp. JAI128]
MDEWRLLLAGTKYGYSYPDDFDRNREYEYRRDGGETATFRMADQSPYFNVAGLMWREINPAARQPKP